MYYYAHSITPCLRLSVPYPRPYFVGVRIGLGTILGRFSIIYFRGLGLRIRVRGWIWVRVTVVLW